MKAFLKKWLAPIKFKRLFDIVASFFALIILSPLFLIICVINLFTPDTKVFSLTKGGAERASLLRSTNSRQ